MSFPRMDPIGLWLVKWVVGPLLFIGMAAWFIRLHQMGRQCQAMAEERGYIEGRYSPPNRAGFGEECVCRKKLNPDGTTNEAARLVIDLD